MLATLTSRQVADWLAFATMEMVGNPLPPDKDAEKKKEQDANKNQVIGWLKSKAQMTRAKRGK